MRRADADGVDEGQPVAVLNEKAPDGMKLPVIETGRFYQNWNRPPSWIWNGYPDPGMYPMGCSNNALRAFPL
jgi:hypothetical protein